METAENEKVLNEWRERSLVILNENPPGAATDNLIWLLKAYYEELNMRTEITAKSSEALKSAFK